MTIELDPNLDNQVYTQQVGKWAVRFVVCWLSDYLTPDEIGDRSEATKVASVFRTLSADEPSGV